MTRTEYAKKHLPEFKTLLDLTYTDFTTGEPIYIDVTPESFDPALELWWRKYMAKKYNEFVGNLRSLDAINAARKDAASFRKKAEEKFEREYKEEQAAEEATHKVVKY